MKIWLIWFPKVLVQRQRTFYPAFVHRYFARFRVVEGHIRSFGRVIQRQIARRVGQQTVEPASELRRNALPASKRTSAVVAII
jgi:hypothetical protein